MDPRDLKAASKYVNNLLASRGLSRGKEIAFHKPADDESTPSKIINLVHELLTRRDKEEEERETLALTLRTLRTNEDKQVETIEQLKTKNADLERKNALLESAQRNFASTLRTTEATARQLKDEATRIRTTLSQVRTQCANDLRKRDIQIQKMKERLLDTRGRGARAPMAQCTVIGGPPNLSSSLGGSIGSAAGAADDSTLAQDTTDFLTKLSQDLADENDNLIALVQTTLSTLKAIQGLPDDDHFLPSDLPAETELDDDASPVVAPPANFDDLTAELDSTLYSLKEVLNQPNYVPLEDLAERDAEIERLITKNATLEEEWRKAIALVDGWNKTLGAKFAEVTQEEGMKSPKRTPGKGKGRALADIIHDGGRQEEPEEQEQEQETVVVMGRREMRSELSIVQEEVEEEEVEEVEEAEVQEEEQAEVQEEEEVPEIRQPPARMEKKRKPLTPRPTVKASKPAAREAIVPRSRATPTSAKKGKGKQVKAVQISVEEATKETAEEAAVEEQILAEVHATPLKTSAKTPAKTPRKTPARKGKRTVRISEAAPEMFSADEMATEVEEVHEVHEKAGRTPGRKGGKLKSVKKDVQPKAMEVVHEKFMEEPQKTPAKERRGAKRGDRPEVIQEPVEAQEVEPEPVLEVQQSSARWRAKAVYGRIPEKEAVPLPEAQVSPVKGSRKRKAAPETLEGATQDSIIVEDAPQGRERKRRARKEDVMPDAETAVQDTEPQAPRGRERGRRTRRGDVTLEADTTNTAADTTAAAQDEEPIPVAPLVLARKDRRRRPSQARTDMDELLELALLLPSPSPEPEIIAEEEVPEPSNKRERRSRAKEADESMAEDTFARLATRDESAAAVETPKRTRRPSRSRKEVQEDSAMLDELAAEPVLLHYHEFSNEAQTVGVKNHEEAGGKLSRARRRSLRNRDKYPVAAKTGPELTPKRQSEVQKRTKKSARKRSSLSAEEFDSLLGAV